MMGFGECIILRPSTCAFHPRSVPASWVSLPCSWEEPVAGGIRLVKSKTTRQDCGGVGRIICASAYMRIELIFSDMTQGGCLVQNGTLCYL